MSTKPRECTICDEKHINWEYRDEAADRVGRGAVVSVEVGPCPNCGYVWKADPRAAEAKCPQCIDVGFRDVEAPTVSVPDEAKFWLCLQCESTRGI